MKRIIRNKRIIAIAFFTVFSVNSSKAMANNNNKESAINLKYAGDIYNQPLYKLTIGGNINWDEFTIIIRDEHSNTLFSENIRAENFSKSFLLNTEEIGDDTLHFEIVNKTTRQSVSYELNCYSHLENAMA